MHSPPFFTHACYKEVSILFIYMNSIFMFCSGWLGSGEYAATPERLVG